MAYQYNGPRPPGQTGDPGVTVPGGLNPATQAPAPGPKPMPPMNPGGQPLPQQANPMARQAMMAKQLRQMPGPAPQPGPIMPGPAPQPMPQPTPLPGGTSPYTPVMPQPASPMTTSMAGRTARR